MRRFVPFTSLNLGSLPDFGECPLVATYHRIGVLDETNFQDTLPILSVLPGSQGKMAVRPIAPLTYMISVFFVWLTATADRQNNEKHTFLHPFDFQCRCTWPYSYNTKADREYTMGKGARGGESLPKLRTFQNLLHWNCVFLAWFNYCPKKITIGIWVSIAKEPFMESEKPTRIMKLWLFFYNSVKTPSDLAK